MSINHMVNERSDVRLCSSASMNCEARPKWSAVDTAYANTLVNDFRHGLLDIPVHTSLQMYLSRMLRCDKKSLEENMTGTNLALTYSPIERSSAMTSLMESAQKRREELYVKWCAQRPSINSANAMLDVSSKGTKMSLIEQADDWMRRTIEKIEEATEAIELVPLLLEGRTYMQHLKIGSQTCSTANQHTYLNSLCNELQVGYTKFATATQPYSSPFASSKLWHVESSLMYSDGKSVNEENLRSLKMQRLYCILTERERYMRMVAGNSYSAAAACTLINNSHPNEIP